MSRVHLLWWVFTYLKNNYPDVLSAMERDLQGDDKHPWVNAALRERLDAWRKSLG